ncbi:MAG: glycoside hydrolase family 28 protein [Lentisphaeria bacterium]|nr:glycoside hydrolase family 28 protein [Lentisphaeria bacterium]
MNFYDTLFEMEEIRPPEFPPREFRLRDHPDIQSAVDACAAQGGGTVVIPAGRHESGPVRLHSRIRLHLDEGAVVVFSDRPSDYLPVVFTRWEGMECYNYSPLIYADSCENVAVTGSGTLIGNGKSWWPWKKRQQPAATGLCHAQADGIPVEQRIYGTEEAALRPSFIQFIRCRNVLIEGIRVEDGPQWTLHPVYCENVLIRHVDIDTNGHNTDGLNPDSCRNVLIEHCRFATGDDCIALNSGMNEDGWRVGKPCENVVVRHCAMTRGHGGVVIGSGMSGGIRNVCVRDCRISGTFQGIRLKSMRGRGGFVENIRFRDITIDNVSCEAVQISMFYPYSTVEPRSQAPSVFRDIRIENVTGRGAATGLEIRGLPESPVQGLLLADIRLAARSAVSCSDVGSIEMRNVEIETPADGG